MSMRFKASAPIYVIIGFATATVFLAAIASAGTLDFGSSQIHGVVLSVIVLLIGGAATFSAAFAVARAARAELSERKRLEQHLNFLSDHDGLTGLPNRRRFERELEQHVSVARRYGRDGAMLMIDLGRDYDNDDVLIGLATAIQDRLRDSDVMARMGDEEFAVLLPETNRDGAIAIADALLEVIRRQTVTMSEHGVSRASASIGLALVKDVIPLGASNLLLAADSAMSDAKDSGRDRLAVYDPRRYERSGAS